MARAGGLGADGIGTIKIMVRSRSQSASFSTCNFLLTKAVSASASTLALVLASGAADTAPSPQPPPQELGLIHTGGHGAGAQTAKNRYIHNQEQEAEGCCDVPIPTGCRELTAYYTLTVYPGL